jgi:hypothetical protein
MSRGVLYSIAFVAALVAAAVLFGDRISHMSSDSKPGFLGLEFAPLTRAAQGRAPFLTEGGALVVKVVEKSPAAQSFVSGEIVTAINGAKVGSASDAAQILQALKPGQHVTLTYFDLVKGDGHPRKAVAVLAEAPPKSETVYSVEPPRTLAREWDFEPSMAAGASWSNSIARGPVNPLALDPLAQGRCSALAPEDWAIAGVAKDGSTFELVSTKFRMRAIFTITTVAARANVENAIHLAIAKYARITPVTGPAQMAEGGYRVIDFGSMSGYSGFALYRVRPRGMTGLVIATWIAAVPASNVAALAPIAGAVALSIRCSTALGGTRKPFDDTLKPTSVSVRCLNNDCDEGDFAGAYNDAMHTGYVHGETGDNYLIDPRKDVWATGPTGPATYRQVGGTLEKLEPGRTN